MAIKINIADLSEGSEEIDFISKPKELGLDENLVKDRLFITAEVFKVSNQVDMKINIKGRFRFNCDMCLEEFEMPFEKEFELVFVQKAAREEILDNDYIKTYNPFMKAIDITQDVREYALLAIPMKKLPAENSDGTCSWCGRPMNSWDRYIKKEEE